MKQALDLGIQYPITPQEVQKLNRLLLAIQLQFEKVHQLRRLYTSTTNKTVSNTTTETTLIGAGRGTLTLDTNFFQTGRVVRLQAEGFYSTQAVAVGLTFRVKKGSTVLLTTGSQTPTNGLSNRFWRMDAELTGQSATTVIAQSVVELMTTATSNPTYWEAVNTSAVTINANQETMSITVQWAAGVAAADTITCTNFTMETTEG